ncbi:MAG: glycosyltransferase family 4 protein, partial [Phycisphaerae bacterium]|nr:glycosyltransferase family 4 protein [Phycisphaerae bacterium]
PAPWVIAISQYVAEQLQRHYQFDSTRIATIFNGVDPDASSADDRRADRVQIRRQYGLAEDDLVALCVAHNFKLKGVGRLIEALAKPGGQAWRTLIVGRDNPGPYVQLAEQLGVKDRIIFAGSTTRTATFFHAADVLVHPTYYDPCSRVVLEAMAAGLPAITTRYNGASERIQHGVDGYVIDSPENVDDMAEGLEQLANAEHRRTVSARTAAAVADCSMLNHARQVKVLYERVIAERAKVGG